MTPGAGLPTVSVKRFPIDARLAFFRVVLEGGGGIDSLAGLVETLQQRLADVTSEIKTTLRQDGGAFIMAFLADRRFMTKNDMIALCEQTIKDPARLPGADGETQ